MDLLNAVENAALIGTMRPVVEDAADSRTIGTIVQAQFRYVNVLAR